MMERRNEERRKTVQVREDTRRKCGQMVVVESECERGEERGDENGMERELREERPAKMEEGREEILLLCKRMKGNESWISDIKL